MKHMIIPTLIAVSLLAMPTVAKADKWYQSGWVIGSAGVLVGGVVGYSLGRHERSYSNRHHYSPVTTCYAGSSAPYYAEETRVWPIYRRTKIYPLASVRSYREDYVSQAYPPGYEVSRDNSEAREKPAPAPAPSIQIGDNNQNVSITIGQTTESTARRADVRPVLNYRVDETVGRSSERYVDTVVEQPSEEGNSTPSRSPETETE